MKENQYGYSDLEWGAMTLDEKIATERFFEIQELKAEVKEARNAALSEAIENIEKRIPQIAGDDYKYGLEQAYKRSVEILEGLKIKV